MFHNRTINTRINKLHFCALRLVYDDFTATFEKLLTKDGFVTINQQNLQALMIEMFKVINGLAPNFMKEIFRINDNSDSGNVSARTRAHPKFYNRSNPRKVKTGLETVSCLGPKI